MATTPLIANYETTADERSMATLAHVLQVIGAWIAPLIIFLIRRQSKFVAFHALQALFLQIAYLVAMVGTIIVFVFAVVGGLVVSGNHQQPPVALFVFFPLLWLAIMAGWIVMLVVAIMYGVKANRGEWAQYPVIGGWVRRILHI